jgi:regulatory protein
MKIVKLEPSQHKAGRWLVWLEDGSLVRVGEGDVVSLSLYAGKELSDDDAFALTAAEQQRKLNERAVNMLSARPMSRKELIDKLCTPNRRKSKTGAPETISRPDPETLARERETLRAGAEQVADRLEELGLLNDREYAQTVARHYAAKGYGERKLREELYRRGVPREHWDEALEGVETTDDTLDKLVQKKLRGAEPTRENLKKVSDYLARRGYSWEDISAALRRCEEEGPFGEL